MIHTEPVGSNVEPFGADSVTFGLQIEHLHSWRPLRLCAMLSVWFFFSSRQDAKNANDKFTAVVGCVIC